MSVGQDQVAETEPELEPEPESEQLPGRTTAGSEDRWRPLQRG